MGALEYHAARTNINTDFEVVRNWIIRCPPPSLISYLFAASRLTSVWQMEIDHSVYLFVLIGSKPPEARQQMPPWWAAN